MLDESLSMATYPPANAPVTSEPISEPATTFFAAILATAFIFAVNGIVCGAAACVLVPAAAVVISL